MCVQLRLRFTQEREEVVIAAFSGSEDEDESPAGTTLADSPVTRPETLLMRAFPLMRRFLLMFVYSLTCAAHMLERQLTSSEPVSNQ